MATQPPASTSAISANCAKTRRKPDRAGAAVSASESTGNFARLSAPSSGDLSNWGLSSMGHSVDAQQVT